MPPLPHSSFIGSTEWKHVSLHADPCAKVDREATREIWNPNAFTVARGNEADPTLPFKPMQMSYLALRDALLNGGFLMLEARQSYVGGYEPMS